MCDQTGSGKSKMAAFKLQMLCISTSRQDVNKELLRLRLCFWCSTSKETASNVVRHKLRSRLQEDIQEFVSLFSCILLTSVSSLPPADRRRRISVASVSLRPVCTDVAAWCTASSNFRRSPTAIRASVVTSRLHHPTTFKLLAYSFCCAASN